MSVKGVRKSDQKASRNDEDRTVGELVTKTFGKQRKRFEVMGSDNESNGALE